MRKHVTNFLWLLLIAMASVILGNHYTKIEKTRQEPIDLFAEGDTVTGQLSNGFSFTIIKKDTTKQK